MNEEIIKLFLIIFIIGSGIKIFFGLPWGMFFWGARYNLFGNRLQINAPKKKSKIWSILCILVIECLYLYFFSPQEKDDALLFSLSIGPFIGILALIFYNLAVKKKEDKPIPAWIKIEETNLIDVVWIDYLKNPFGFFVIVLGFYIFFSDFFDVLVMLICF